MFTHSGDLIYSQAQSPLCHACNWGIVTGSNSHPRREPPDSSRSASPLAVRSKITYRRLAFCSHAPQITPANSAFVLQATPLTVWRRYTTQTWRKRAGTIRQCPFNGTLAFEASGLASHAQRFRGGEQVSRKPQPCDCALVSNEAREPSRFTPHWRSRWVLTPRGPLRSTRLAGESVYRSGTAPIWCRWRGSNPHARRHWVLKPARLPVPPHRQNQNSGGDGESRTLTPSKALRPERSAASSYATSPW